MSENRENGGSPVVEPGADFFNSIRQSGWFRAEPRWVAGVCSGIAVRTGWDVRLVRGVAAIVSLLLVFPLIFYAAAWFLLPDGRRGPIQLQLFLAGTFTAAQLGAGSMLFIGLVATPIGFAWFPAALLWTAIVLGITGLIIFLINASTNAGRVPAAAGSAGAEPNTERFNYMNTPTPNEGRFNQAPQYPQNGQNHGYPPAGPGPAGPYRTYPGAQSGRPVPPPKQGPAISNTTGFITLGILLLIAAAGIATMFVSSQPVKVVLLTSGIIVGITGGVLSWAAYRGKRGGWFLGFSIGGAIILLPSLAIGAGIAAGISSYENHPLPPTGYVEQDEGTFGESDLGSGDRPYFIDTNAELDHETASFTAMDSDVLVDLTAAPAGSTIHYEYELMDSDLTVLLRSDQLPDVHRLLGPDTEFIAISEDETVQQSSLDSWVESGFDSANAPFSARSQVDMTLDAFDSTVTFVFLPDEETEIGTELSRRDQREHRHPHRGPGHRFSNEAQSGN